MDQEPPFFLWVSTTFSRKPIATPSDRGPRACFSRFCSSRLRRARFSLSSLPARRGCFCTRFLCAGGNRRNCTERIGYADCAGLSLTEHSMLDEASHWNVFIVGPPSAKHRAQAETGGQRHQTVDPADAGDGLAGRGDDERAKFHHISFHYPGCGSESA